MYRPPPALRDIYNGKDVEFKVTDEVGSGGVTTGGTVVNLLGSIARGNDSLNQFVGSSITPRGIQIRLAMQSTDTYNYIRVVVFQWFDATVPVLGGILQAAPYLIAPVMLTNRENMVILHDRLYFGNENFSGAGATAMMTSPRKTIYIKGKRLAKCIFPNGSLIPQKGGLYMLLLSDSLAPPNPGVDYWARTTFTDQ